MKLRSSFSGRVNSCWRRRKPGRLEITGGKSGRSTWSSSLLLIGAPKSQHSTDTVSEFHAEVPQATASEGLAQGPHAAARAEFEHTTLRTKGVDSINEPW